MKIFLLSSLVWIACFAVLSILFINDLPILAYVLAATLVGFGARFMSIGKDDEIPHMLGIMIIASAFLSLLYLKAPYFSSSRYIARAPARDVARISEIEAFLLRHRE